MSLSIRDGDVAATKGRDNMAATVTVFEVLYHSDDPSYAHAGAAGDGSFVERFRKRGDADRFAAGKCCYGRPATVTESVVSRRLARRWGC